MILKKINQLRSLFQKHDIDGYIISTKDEYLSEYPPKYAKRLEYLTGFTGSNGLAIILKGMVLFFTDGRYLTQCQQQLDQKIFQVFDLKLLGETTLSIQNKVIGFDPKIFTYNSFTVFKNINLKPILPNLIDQIWVDQPNKPNSEIYNYAINFTGQTSVEKIDKCRKFIHEHDGDCLIINDSASVCWLFNIRASDIEFSPLLLARALITKDETFIFTHENRLLPYNIKIYPEEDLVRKIQDFKGIILFDDNFCTKYLLDIIKLKSHKIVVDPCLLWKACKNEVEINCMKESHIEDGIAVCEFLAYLENNDLSNYTEYDLGLLLLEFRSKGKNYVSDSFPAIVGYQDNGAVIHYRATAHTAKKINGSGLLLIDSGGQYLGGTTDITRVISIGKPDPEYKKYYTNILKGHLALAMARFPINSVTGANLDILARQFLWRDGDDYAHGTGHGVGSFLSVHEGPQNISLSSYQIKFKPGMILSNEPGYYRPKHFGIRIENLMFVEKVNNMPSFLEFQQLTLVPYAKDLINLSKLNRYELDFLEKYYALIRQKILPNLSLNAQKWLNDELNINKNS